MVSRRRFWGYLRIQVLVILLVVLILPLGCVGWFYYQTLSGDLGKIEKSHALEVGDSASRLIEQLGEQLSGTAITNAKWADYVTAIRSGDMDWIEENVNASVDIIPHVNFTATVGFDGSVLTQSGDVPEFSGKLKELSIVDKVKKLTDTYGLMQTSKGLAIVAASQIMNEEGTDKSDHFLVFGRLLDDDAMKGIGVILNAKIGIRGANDQRLGSDQQAIGLFGTGAGFPESQSFEEGKIDNNSYGIVKSGFPSLTGNRIADIVVAVPAEASGKVKEEMVRISLIAGALAILLIALIAVIVRIRIIVPLVGFDRFLREVASGRLTDKLPEKVMRRGDEIGSIAQSLAGMVDQLKTLVSGIRETAAATSSAAAQLTGEADSAADGANRIAESMREVAAGADSQAQGMKRGAEVTREIQQGMTTIADRTSSVAAVSEQATIRAVEGNETVKQAVDKIETIAAAAGLSVEDALSLHVKSEQIGRMVEAISGIAYRTNLLALNANIEASRAGEHGKGFAVVAGEVRKLALQSDVTAQDIRNEVEEIQALIEKVKTRIENGYRETQGGAAIVREAGGVFENISNGIKDMEAELREIAAAGQEIEAQVEELSALVAQTEAISESSAERSQEVADISDTQMGSVRMVADAMVRLSGRIRELEQAVNKFKL
ncbi:methyl-accepting chemotaxis protein [Cohnella soli]|uniref:Methyl-accepting chemotaxis protein n=1 Tax=Cohnella soli TaxID=425005 RepID=A0ABW0HZ36_9BACL